MPAIFEHIVDKFPHFRIVIDDEDRAHSSVMLHSFSDRMLDKSLFSPAPPRRLLHPPAPRLPILPLCPGTRLFPAS